MTSKGKYGMKAGDWVVPDFQVGQIKEMCEGGNASFSDGYFETSGRLDAMLAQGGKHMSGDIVTNLLVKMLEEQADFLDLLANRIDGWADETRKGSWSTHQVSVNEQTANECRRNAAILRQHIAAARSTP